MEAQRLLAAYAAMSAAAQSAVYGWLASVGGEGVLMLDLPRVERVELCAARAASEESR